MSLEELEQLKRLLGDKFNTMCFKELRKTLDSIYKYNK